MIPDSSHFVARCDGYDLWLVGQDMLPVAQDVVYRTYAHIFGRLHGWRDADAGRAAMAVDDARTAAASIVYAAFDPAGRCVGTIRLIDREQGHRLPVERDFGFDTETVCARRFGFTPGRVFEVARFAVPARGALHRPVADDLIALAIAYAGDDPTATAVAGLDTTVLRLLAGRGVVFSVVGSGHDHLGSPTTPAVLPSGILEPELWARNPDLYRRAGRERVWHRVQAEANVELRLLHGTRCGRLTDLSVDGAAIALSPAETRGLTGGAEVTLSFELGGRPIEMDGQIVYVAPTPNADVRCGVRFAADGELFAPGKRDCLIDFLVNSQEQALDYALAA